MKKIFTLIAATLMAVSAMAQTSWNFSEWATGDYEDKTVNGLTLNGKWTVDANNKTVDGVNYTQRIKSGGKRTMSFDVPANATITMILCTSTTDAARNYTLSANGTVFATEVANVLEKKVINYTGAATTVTFETDGGTNFYYIEVKEGGNEPGPEPEDNNITFNTENQIFFTEAYTAGSLNGKTLVAGDLKMKVVDTASKITVDKNTAYFGTLEEKVSFDYRFRTNGKSQASNSLTLTVPSDGNLYIYARTGSNNATDRNIQVIQNSQTLVDKILLESDAVGEPYVDSEGNNKTRNIYPIINASVKAGNVTIAYPVNGINIYAISFGKKISTGIQDATIAAPAQVKKSLRNGQIVIETANGTFNAVGAQVK